MRATAVIERRCAMSDLRTPSPSPASRLVQPMSTYRLDKLFSPRSVAVVGARARTTSPGRAVLRILRAASCEGSIGLATPRYAEIEGIPAVKTIEDLPQA